MGVFKKIRKAVHKGIKFVPGVGQVYNLIDEGARATGLTGAVNRALESPKVVRNHITQSPPTQLPHLVHPDKDVSSQIARETQAYAMFSTESNPAKKAWYWIKYQYVKAKYLVIGIGVGLLLVLLNRLGLLSNLTRLISGGSRW